MSLFDGTPITATTSSQSTTQTPKWMQDAIYNQVQNVQNVSSLPFQQYTGNLTAAPNQNLQSAWQKAAAGTGAWQPQINAAQQGLQQLTQRSGGLSAAQPYLNRAGQSASAGISEFMNPYTQNVTDRIAQLGARNLSENLLPAVSDSFVRAGQFGGSRMGEFGSRALRDTQEAILGQQADALQSGFGTALSAAQGERARQLQLGQTAGDLAGDDITQQSGLYNNLLNAAQQGQQLAQGDINLLSQAGQQQLGIEQGGLDAMYQQYLRSQAYPQQQTQFATSQLSALSPMVPSVQMQTGVSPSGVNPSTASQVVGGLAGLAGLFS